ncbi:MAG: hypothetical protein AABW73_01240 [Nanoarchaeota archaeon]
MEERKLIKQGGGGLTIYLPKKWVDRRGLKNGDNVRVLETDTSLIIEGDINTKNEIKIDINESNIHDLRHLLTHAYRRGFSKIIISYNKPQEIIKETKKVTSNVLLGFEVTSIEQKSIIIENISEPSEEKFDVMLQKVFLVISETNEVLLKDFTNGKFSSIDEIKELRDQGDKFIIFCKRLITKNRNDKNSLLEWEFMTFLMDIHHNYYYLYHYAHDNKIKTNKNFSQLIKDLGLYFSDLRSAYLKRDVSIVHRINEQKKKYHFGEIIKLLEKSRGEENIIYSYIREIFRSIQLSTSPIMSMSLGY